MAQRSSRPSVRKTTKAKKKGGGALHPFHKLYAVIVGLLFLATAVTAVFFMVNPAQAGTTADNGSKVVWESWKDSRTLDLTVTSPSIDGPTKTVRLILPSGWSKTSDRTWPTLWLLHGGMDNHESWTKGTNIKELVAGKDVMVVIPETSWCSAYTDWWNYGKYGKPAWETYITNDLPQILARGYKADVSKRAVAGPSMGGLGAMKLAANHNDKYQAAASFSGNVDPLHAYNNMADSPNLPGLGCLSDWKRVWGDYKILDQRAIWERNDPYVQAHKLSNLNYLYVSSGDGSADPLNNKTASDIVEKGVYEQGKAIVKRLEGLGVPVDNHFYQGTHTWPYWQLELKSALPGMLQAIGVE